MQPTEISRERGNGISLAITLECPGCVCLGHSGKECGGLRRDLNARFTKIVLGIPSVNTSAGSESDTASPRVGGADGGEEDARRPATDAVRRPTR